MLFDFLCHVQMFLGMIRQSCGGSDHPTANQFLYSYRLLSVKSLIRAPRGAIVSSSPVELLGSLKASAPAVDGMLVTIYERAKVKPDFLLVLNSDHGRRRHRLAVFHDVRNRGHGTGVQGRPRSSEVGHVSSQCRTSY